MSLGATVAALLVAVVLMFFLALSGLVAAYASYSIYSIGNLAQAGQLLTAHTVVTTAAMVSLFVVIALFVVFVSVAGARGFAFTSASDAEADAALAWDSGRVTADLLGGARAKGTYRFFATFVGIVAAFAIVAFGLALEGWIALEASQASGPVFNTAKWATIAAAALFLVTFGLFLGCAFVYVKYANKASQGIEKIFEVFGAQAVSAVA